MEGPLAATKMPATIAGVSSPAIHNTIGAARRANRSAITIMRSHPLFQTTVSQSTTASPYGRKRRSGLWISHGEFDIPLYRALISSYATGVAPRPITRYKRNEKDV